MPGGKNLRRLKLAFSNKAQAYQTKQRRLRLTQVGTAAPPPQNPFQAPIDEPRAPRVLTLTVEHCVALLGALLGVGAAIQSLYAFLELRIAVATQLDLAPLSARPFMYATFPLVVLGATVVGLGVGTLLLNRERVRAARRVWVVMSLLAVALLVSNWYGIDFMTDPSNFVVFLRGSTI
ncbi:MAG: hypothetical protein H6718_10425 [Polyangiaceae bacterium]|nr:hypothetical protein [Myxococcales bacterium]MCB9585807.1 hypothetical protein [Polyangiaceae bacterium]MCB9607264.1 hypothetical protein [Polyangiaceae bacterium]